MASELDTAANAHRRKVATALLTRRAETHTDDFWAPLVKGHEPSKNEANEFLVSAILDYQMPAHTAWENGARLARMLEEPNGLWNAIAEVPFDDWMGRASTYRLHRFWNIAQKRVHRIARDVVLRYNGDARNIWNEGPVATISQRLEELQVGEQISRMIVGALIDVGLASGQADVKVDVHVRRVLGRLIRGEGYTESEENEVLSVTRELSPANPWLLDYPLYSVGKDLCSPKAPKCDRCQMNSLCKYALG